MHPQRAGLGFTNLSSSWEAQGASENTADESVQTSQSQEGFLEEQPLGQNPQESAKRPAGILSSSQPCVPHRLVDSIYEICLIDCELLLLYINLYWKSG